MGGKANEPLLASDIHGQPQSTPDIGADERSGEPEAIRGPLTTANVGPDSP
jgi:hypothetical protein